MAEKTEKTEKTDKEKALDALNKRPENFRWTINDTTFTRDGLIKEAEAGSTAIIGMAKDLRDPGGSNQLGKRYKCLVCGTEVLATKAGAGKANCCGQEMEVQEPKPLPSSD